MSSSKGLLDRLKDLVRHPSEVSSVQSWQICSVLACPLGCNCLMYDSDRIVCRRTEVFGLMTSSARLAMNVTHHFISFCGGITAGAVPHAIVLFVQQQTLALLETHA